MNEGIVEIADQDLQHVNGGSFWNSIVRFVAGPLYPIFDNWVDPPRVGDDPLINLNAGNGDLDEDGAQEGAGGSGE